MAKNIIMNYHNGSSYEELYPKTQGTQVYLTDGTTAQAKINNMNTTISSHTNSINSLNTSVSNLNTSVGSKVGKVSLGTFMGKLTSTTAVQINTGIAVANYWCLVITTAFSGTISGTSTTYDERGRFNIYVSSSSGYSSDSYYGLFASKYYTATSSGSGKTVGGTISGTSELVCLVEGSKGNMGPNGQDIPDIYISGGNFAPYLFLTWDYVTLNTINLTASITVTGYTF